MSREQSVTLPDESGEENKQCPQHVPVTPLDLEQSVHTMDRELETSEIQKFDVRAIHVLVNKSI